MQRSDRLVGILLQLNDVEFVPASRLAEQFEVSVRTIYRDMDALGELGIPFYAETGRSGGFRLVEGYRLPPVMFTEGEAISLILGVTILDSLKTHPHASDLVQAEGKLLNALPPPLQQTLRNARRIIGFEKVATDAFHIERSGNGYQSASAVAPEVEGPILDVFLSAIFDGKRVQLHYKSPYRHGGPRSYEASPIGLFWDRNCWYLVGRLAGGESRTWRADRVLEISVEETADQKNAVADINAYLDRSWLASAMQTWAENHPVTISLTLEQAKRLEYDWYYQHAIFNEQPDGQVLMTFGQNDPDIVRELVRWLGPDAELVAPAEWRELVRRDLEAMLDVYRLEPDDE